ncbi:hypothetical protein R50072_26210 [Simiduia litorea]|uniref:cold-shock protein n=1 Tax=Simiduia litorea TaxID=1435348 RepID=UPI0036F1BB1F
MAKGTIKRYDFRKGFGFISDDSSGKDFFFHKSEWQGDGPIRQGLAVEFDDKDSDKGPQAEAVMPLDGSGSKSSNHKKSPKPAKVAAKPATLEDRLASLESAVGTWKILSLLALAGVIALAVERFAF